MRHLRTTAAAALVVAGLVGAPNGPATATDPGPPTHYVATKLMAVDPDSGAAYVSPNGRYLLVNHGFSGEVYDLVDGVSLGSMTTNASVQLVPAAIDDNGIVVGTYTTISTGVVTGFHWFGKDAVHPLGHANPDEVPGGLIESIEPVCKMHQGDEDLQWYG